MIRRKSLPWLTTGLTVLAVAISALAASTATASQVRTAPCNGSSELCERPFDQVTLPGSHNSMSAGELGWKNPNQTYSIPHQLERGARAMLIDVHYGKQVSLGITQVSKAEGAAAGYPIYLCHDLCGWGSTELIPELRRIRDFYAEHPREVGLFVVQDAVEPDDFAAAVEESGLIDFVYRGPTTEADGWPTLGEMIRTNQRIVFLAEQDAGSVPWYHRAYSGTIQETPYEWPRSGSNNPENYTGVQFLTDPPALASSCVANRGGTTAPLFLMNHWVSGTGIPPNPGVIPERANAEVVNSKAALVARARACEMERGIKPTVLTVDFFGTGDVVGAARELNGVKASPYLELSRRPNATTVRAGKTATFRLTLNNLGDLAGKPRVCAVPPKRLAGGRCVTATVPSGGSRVVTLKLRTRKKAKGRGPVKFQVTGVGDRLTAKAKLKVKPKPNRRKRR